MGIPTPRNAHMVFIKFGFTLRDVCTAVFFHLGKMITVLAFRAENIIPSPQTGRGNCLSLRANASAY